MRQVFLEFPWVHAPAPSAFLPLFHALGRYEKLEAGRAIYNGGTTGEVAYILSGLCTYRTQDARDREHYFTFVPANRLMGNVDAFTGNVVNVIDFALRPTEIFLMPRQLFLEHLAADPDLMQTHTRMLIREHESDMEGLLSCASDPVEIRAARLIAALVFRDECRASFSWEEAMPEAPVPVPYALTPTEIARGVRATRTAVSLIMSRWEREGLLEVRDGVRLASPKLFRLLTDWLTSRGGPAPKVAKSRRKAAS